VYALSRAKGILVETSGSEPEKEPACTLPVESDESLVREGMDRRNSRIFYLSYLLIYLAAPVIYVGVVQAALCNKLGASATVANLPASAYLFGSAAPFFLSWLIPLRLERSVVVYANAITATLLAMVCATLILPFGNSVRIAVLVGQGLIHGCTASISLVYQFQCLGRGTTSNGRAKALKFAYTFGPISAVVGSLAAQFTLNQGVFFLAYPYDFAFLYFVGVPCMAGVALLSSRYELIPAKEEVRQPFGRYMVDSIRAFSQVRPLVLLWLAYLLWYVSLDSVSNLSLFTKEAVGRDPKELSGLIMALRFGLKSVAGFALGVISLRWGIRAPLVTTIALLVAAPLWSWAAPGYLYLFAFGLMGAGELGGGYFPNYMVAVSPATQGARNLALLNLATPVAGVSPVLYGALTDALGFSASFVLAGLTALAALWFVLKLPAGRSGSLILR
jgi:MFS family permease